MAPDLIPPPSPGGRPDPDAGRYQAPRAGETRPDELVFPTEPVPDNVEAPHRARFGMLLGALIGLAITCMILVAATIAGRDSGAGLEWSSWKPQSDDAYIAAEEIADHVGRQYRLDDGSQLVDVEAGPIEVDDVPLEVVVRQKTEQGDILRVGENGLWYVLNGLGERGSIVRGKPSTQRLALVRREALELAMYTFRYVEGIDHVVTLLPPPPPAKTDASSSHAATEANGLGEDAAIPSMLFREGQLDTQISDPLAMTLDPRTPTPGTLRKRDAELIMQFTEPSAFQARVLPTQTGEGLLVLEQPDNLPPQLQGRITPRATKQP